MVRLHNLLFITSLMISRWKSLIHYCKVRKPLVMVLWTIPSKQGEIRRREVSTYAATI